MCLKKKSMEVSVKCTTSVYLYDLSTSGHLWLLHYVIVPSKISLSYMTTMSVLFFFPVKLLFKGDVKTASLFTVNVI